MQKDSVITQIYDRIKAAGHDEVFIVGDFLDLGEYHAVRRALLRLEEAGCIQKIMRGVFYYPYPCRQAAWYPAASWAGDSRRSLRHPR